MLLFIPTGIQLLLQFCLLHITINTGNRLWLVPCDLSWSLPTPTTCCQFISLWPSPEKRFWPKSTFSFLPHHLKRKYSLTAVPFTFQNSKARFYLGQRFLLQSLVICLHNLNNLHLTSELRQILLKVSRSYKYNLQNPQPSNYSSPSLFLITLLDTTVISSLSSRLSAFYLDTVHQTPEHSLPVSQHLFLFSIHFIPFAQAFY